jgi:hypothetical protein
MSQLLESPRARPPTELAPTSFPARTHKLRSGAEWLDISDDYTEWLNSANAGWLNRGNLLGFEIGVREMPAGTAMVEVGSYLGLSTNLIGYYKRHHKRTERLVTCDCWRPYVPKNALANPAAFGAFTRQTFINNIQMFSAPDLPWTIEATSDAFFDAWDQHVQTKDVLGRTIRLGGDIGFCYIDALHSFEASWKDFTNADKHLVPGGFVLFDDSSDDSNWGVKQTVAKILEMPNYELVFRNPNYMFRKRA